MLEEKIGTNEKKECGTGEESALRWKGMSVVEREQNKESEDREERRKGKRMEGKVGWVKGRKEDKKEERIGRLKYLYNLRRLFLFS